MDGPHARRLSLILPAFNEEAGIRQAVVEADDALARLTADYEILVVDDGSRDGTAAVVEALTAERPCVRLLRHGVNRGYGAALRTGFTAARFEHVAFTDADSQFHLDDLRSLLDLAETHDVAVGWRIDRKDPWRRRFYSRGYNMLVRALLGTGVRDCDCALKVFRRDVVEELLPETNGFFVNAEMLTRARQLGRAVAEVGVRHRPRMRGDSKVSVLDVPRTLRTLLPFWWSRVLFPGEQEDSRVAGTAVLGPLLLLAVAALLCFGRLGTPLQEPTEVAHAEAARRLLLGGDAPTLFAWLIAGCYQIFGVGDRFARLVPGAAAILLVVLTWFWGRRAAGPRAALVGAFMLCLSAGPLYFVRLLTPDCLTALLSVAALAAAHRGLTGNRLAWVLAAFCSGAAVLSGGWVVAALILVPVLTLAMLDPRTSRPDAPVCVASVITFAAVVGVGMTRFAPPPSPIRAGNGVAALATLLLGMAPWTLLVPALFAFLMQRSATVAQLRQSALGYFLLCAGWAALLALVTGNGAFTLAVAPPLALALACYLDAVLRLRAPETVAWTWGVRGGRPAAVMVLIGGATVSLTAAGADLLHPTAALATAALACAAAFALVRWSGRLQPRTAWAFCGAATFALLFAGVHGLLPAHARRLSLRGQVRPYASLCVEDNVPVVCYPRRWDSVGFYLRPADVRVFASGERDALLATLREHPCTLFVADTDEPLRELPATMEFVPAARAGTVTVGLVRRRPQAPEVLFAYGP